MSAPEIALFRSCFSAPPLQDGDCLDVRCLREQVEGFEGAKLVILAQSAQVAGQRLRVARDIHDAPRAQPPDWRDALPGALAR